MYFHFLSWADSWCILGAEFLSSDSSYLEVEHLVKAAYLDFLHVAAMQTINNRIFLME